MATVIPIPQNFNLRALNRFTSFIVGKSGGPANDSFVFDFERLHFIDGTGYTVLSNTIAWLVRHGIECRFKNVSSKTGGIAYLDDCGFFSKYIGKALSDTSTCRDSTLPCQEVQNASAHGWLETTFSEWMCRQLRVSHAGLASIRICVKELFNNILDHSTLDTGLIHVQLYPSTKIIRITISDFGLGIPHTIRQRYGQMADHQAIVYATQEGVTAKSRPNNMGAGLSLLIDRVTYGFGDVQIHSFSGSVNCFRDKKGLHKMPRLWNAS